jgi:two-component system, OmpR family, response regulator TctD
MAELSAISTTASIDPTAPPIDAQPAPTARRGAILIVEDRDDVRQGLSQLLEFQGYVVFEAGDSTEAFAQLDSSPHGIALILLDLNLPGASGESVRATQLANPEVSEIPTIVVSACSPDIPGSAELRAAAWLEKPFRFEQLLDEVRRFVLPEGSNGLKTSSQVQPPAA